MDRLNVARAIARAMDRSGFQAAAENFVSRALDDYNDRQLARLERIWLS